MLRRTLALLTVLAIPSAVTSCSGGTNPSDVTDSGTNSETGGGGGTPTNTSFCPTGGPSVSSTCKGLNVCGVCVAVPTVEAKRTTDTKEFADPAGGPVDVSCLVDGAAPRTLGTPKNVSFKGHVKIFANGNDTSNVKVEIYKWAPGGALGTLVGSATTPVCHTTGAAPCDTVLAVTKDPGGGNPTYTQYELSYQIDNVPTETQLIVKTSSATTDAGWFPLYDYNIVALNSKLASDGTYAYDARALGNADYGSILRAAYAKSPDSGQSAIAGEVHDCGDVRIQNATVGVGPTAGYGIFYLSSNEDNPLPDSGKSYTTRTGLYAAGGISPGSYRVSALGKVGGKMVALGAFDIQTFPDSVSAFTFRGTPYMSK